MTPENYSNLKRYVQRKLFSFAQEFVEDCTQYVAMKLLENPRRHWRHVIYDWCRENGYSEKSQVRVGAKALAFKVNRSEEEMIELLGKEFVYVSFDLISHDLNRLINLANSRSQDVLKLFQVGLSQADISRELKITPGRVSQLMTEGIKDIRRRINSQGLSS